MSARRGWTLIEMLVAIGVVGVLVGLLAPALLKARAAAYAVQCSANLHNIGVALAGYASANGVFPSAQAPNHTLGGRPASYRYISAFAHLLPYLEESDACSSINFAIDSYTPSPLIPSVHDGENGTAAQHRVGVFTCPADRRNLASPGVANYRINVAADPYGVRKGAFEPLLWIRPADVADGLSRTAAVSERLLGSGSTMYDSDRDFWYTGAETLYGGLPPRDVLVDVCSARPASAPHFEWSGASWLVSGYEATYYNHSVPPNSPLFDCSAQSRDRPPFTSGGLISARSSHSAGANVLMLDGAVQLASQGIALEIWQKMATRSDLD